MKKCWFVNYEPRIHGKQNLASVSHKMILNKSADLTIKNSSDFRKYRKPAMEIKELKLQWNQKMKVLEKSVFSQKEIISTNTECQELDDLDFLRKQPHPGPFTTSEAVNSFMENEAEGKEKNKPMYIEVFFQRNTSQSLKKEAAVFRLKRNGKKLETSEYAANLSLYFDQSRSNLTLSDLKNILTELSGTQENLNVEMQQLSTSSKSSSKSIKKQPIFEYGEQIGCV